MLRRSLILLVVAAALASPAHAAESPFPVTLTTVNGKVTLAKRPTRIVSLSPTATESLFALGADAQVVAVDDQSDYPARAPKTKLSGFTPNAEAVAEYRPDLVIVQFDANGIVGALQKLRIPVLVQPSARSLAGTYNQIVQLGRATGREPKARKLVRHMRLQIEKLVASAPRAARGASVYHELSPDYYSAASSTFIGRVYALFGLRNIADPADTAGSGGYPKLSGEYIIGANPDLIVLADTRCCGQTIAGVAARPGWDRLTAVRRRAIAIIDDSVASRWGPGVVQFVQAVSRALVATKS